MSCRKTAAVIALVKTVLGSASPLKYVYMKFLWCKFFSFSKFYVVAIFAKSGYKRIPFRIERYMFDFPDTAGRTPDKQIYLLTAQTTVFATNWYSSNGIAAEASMTCRRSQWTHLLTFSLLFSSPRRYFSDMTTSSKLRTKGLLKAQLERRSKFQSPLSKVQVQHSNYFNLPPTPHHLNQGEELKTSISVLFFS